MRWGREGEGVTGEREEEVKGGGGQGKGEGGKCVLG